VRDREKEGKRGKRGKEKKRKGQAKAIRM